MTTSSHLAPDTAVPYPRRWAAMAVLVLGFMLDLLNVTIVNVGLPAIQADLGTAPSQTGWIVTAYLLAFASTLITGARLGDLWGRRRLFLVGLALFALTAAWSGWAQNAPELIAARAVQGIAAGLLAPQVLSSLYTLFQGRERATVFGMFGVVAGIAQAGGLALGGVVVTADIAGLGWRPIFLISVPAAAALLALGLWLVPESRAPHAVRPRWLPTAALTAGLVAIVFSLLEGDGHGWPPWIWALLAGGVVMVAAVALGEHHDPRRRPGALLPLELLRERTSGAALVVQFVAFAAFSGFLLVFVLWLQAGQEYSALRAGLVTIAFSVGGLFMAAFVGRLTMRFGRLVVITGALVSALGTLAILAAASTSVTGVEPWLLVPGLLVIGTGMNLVMPALGTLFLSTVPVRYAGSASGILTTSQQFGGAVGTAGVSVIFFTTAAASGYGAALTASAVTIIVALAVSAALCLALPARKG